MAYFFLTSPGFEVLRNISSLDSQIDLLIRNLHAADPILGEFGKYIIRECKNTGDKVDAKAVRDFASKVIQTSCNSGILITKKGISGDIKKEAARDARLAILKVHQRHGIIIVPLNLEQMKRVISERSLFLGYTCFRI